MRELNQFLLDAVNAAHTRPFTLVSMDSRMAQSGPALCRST
jgi:hypothetical protein